MVTHIFVTPGVDTSTGEGGAFDPDTSQTFVAPAPISGVLFFVIGGGGGGGYAGGGGAGGAVSNAITGSTILFLLQHIQLPLVVEDTLTGLIVMEVIMELHHSLLRHHIPTQKQMAVLKMEIILFGMDILE